MILPGRPNLFRSNFISKLDNLPFTCDREAHCERITRHSVRTGAHRGVIYDCALCILSANSGARIVTLIAKTDFIQWAIWVLHAFGSARGVRVTAILGQAGAHPIVTLCVRSTWGRIAGILWYRDGCKRH